MSLFSHAVLDEHKVWMIGFIKVMPPRETQPGQRAAFINDRASSSHSFQTATLMMVFNLLSRATEQ